MSPDLKRIAPFALQQMLQGALPQQRVVDGTLVFCDVSGFTAATEMLGRKGRIGAELMNELVSLSFSPMLDLAEFYGGDLLVFGGDALFLLFDGEGHCERAVRAANAMLTSLRTSAPARSNVVKGVAFNMSTGVHTGEVWLGAVGSRFPMLFPAGSTVTRVLQLEQIAERGEILVSQEVHDVLSQRSDLADVMFTPSSVDRSAYLLKHAARKFKPVPQTSAYVRSDDSGTPQEALIDPLLAQLVHDADLLEHRDAAVAFVRCDGLDDLDGTTRLHVIEQLVEQTTAEAASQGVCVMASDIAKNGVKLMLGAGLPLVRGEDADRMVSTLRAAVESIPGAVICAGAQVGPMLSGFVGSQTRRVYTGVGDAVNSAARIAANAISGEVVIGDALANRLRSSWQLRARAPFAAKGKKEPVATRAVVDRLVPKQSVTAILPFVGRDQEVAAVQNALLTVDGWTEIIGQPGAGKSRLISEAIVGNPDVRSLECFGDPTAAEAPYHAIGPALLQWIAGKQDAALVGARQLDSALERLHRSGGDVSDSVAGAVRRIFGVDGRGAGTVTSDRRAVHRVVIDLLRGLDRQPTVLVIEDAHWVDASSAELIQTLRSSSLDLRIISTRRPDAGGLSADGTNAIRINLQPLESDALSAAVREVAGNLGISRTELDRLVERSEGNPLVVELLLDASARGLSPDDLPPRAEELAGRLLDSLLPIHRHLLGIAAVCGAGSDVALVGAVSGLALHQVEAQFASLNELADINPDNGSVRFRHALVRDAAYARLPFKERFALHAKVATTVERTRQEFDDTPLLAYHFHRAGEHAKAWLYGKEAGAKAAAADAPVEAAAMYRRALEDAAHLDDVHFAELIVAWEALGAAEQRNGKPAEAEVAFAKAYELTPLLQAELIRRRGRLAADTRRLSVATRWYAKATRTAAATPGRLRDKFLAGVDIDSAAVRYRQGKFGAAESSLMRAIANARRFQDDRRLAHGLYLLTSVSVELGRPGATEYATEAARLFEAIGDKLGLARTLNNLGVANQLTGDWGEAVEIYRKSAAAFQSAGDLSGAAIIQNNLGEILSDQGRLVDAKASFSAALETWEESKFLIGIGLASSNLGRLESRAGRHEEARRLFERATQTFTDIGGWDFCLEARLRLAELELRVGNSDAAEGLLIFLPDTTVEAAKLPGRMAQRARLLGVVASMRGEPALDLMMQSLVSGEQAQNLFEQACTAVAIAELPTSHGSTEVDNEIAEKYARLSNEWFDRLSVDALARRSF